jgi:oligopeptide/dipeptide ABC transporter ATP-binding protein
MRVKDIVSEPLIANKKESKKKAAIRVEKLLEEVGLRPEAAEKYPHEFSGGQRQRIAVARSLALNPQLIILDEPVSSLDMSVRAQIMNLLRKLQKQYGLSYLLIAHDIGTVRYMSNFMAVMYLGKIVEKGPSSLICSFPCHPYTQGLIRAASPVRPGESMSSPIVGEVPSPLNPPSGCSFHTRCPLAMDICKKEEPYWYEVDSGQKVACHLYGEESSQPEHIRKKIIEVLKQQVAL